MKIAEWIVRILFWLQAFAGVVIAFGLIALLVYSRTQNGVIAIILLALGFLGGILAAEYIRRKYGLETFFARVYGPNQMDKRSEEES